MSTSEKRYVEKVLNSYSEKKATKLDELKQLDKKAKNGPRVFAYVFGSISALILGFGMSVAMGAILKDMFGIGLIIGIIGLALVCLNYPIYKKMLASSKAKYAARIKSLSEELLNNNN